MNTRLLLPLALAAALLACTGEEPQPQPAVSPPASDAPTPPPGMTDGDFWFLGVVSEMNTGCYVDATCSVTVEVAESLGGAPLEPGVEVEALAHAAEGGSLAICAGEQYFVKQLQSPD